MWNDRRASDQGEDEEEDMRKRENELKQELNMATLRCEELKRTMIETKSFIDPLHSGKPCNTIKLSSVLYDTSAENR